MGSVNENVAVVPTGSNILFFPFKKGFYFSPGSKHLKFQSVCFLLCLILWLCVVFFWSPKKLIFLLLSAGPLCLSVATSTIMPYRVLQSSRKQRTPDLWQYAQTLSPQGAPSIYSKFFFSLLLFVLSPRDSHIFCSLIYYYCYCSSLDFIKVDFRDFNKLPIITIKLQCKYCPNMFVLGTQMILYLILFANFMATTCSIIFF